MRKPKTMTVQGIKSFLKELSVSIRISKIMRKEEINQNLKSFTEEQKQSAALEPYELDGLRGTFRHYHISYCEFRGRTRTQIEAKTDNPPSESWIKDIKEEIAAAMAELKGNQEDAS